jgi:hypothetical protein
MPPHVFQKLPRPVTAFLLAGCKRKPREALINCLRELADEGLVRYRALVQYALGPLGLPGKTVPRPSLAYR